MSIPSSPNSPWTRGLNPEQAEAVMHTNGPLLILAGAGSGKTTVLVSRTGRMISDGSARADQICVLTFTNKAARELKHRVKEKLQDMGRDLWAGTFHSFGLQTLRKNHKLLDLPSQFGIIDQSDSQSILKDLIKNIKNSGKDKFDLEKLLIQINFRRAKKKSPTIELDEYYEMAEALAPKYEKELNKLGVVDFEGLLLEPLKLFTQHPDILERTARQFSQVMVDEFQDTNSEQMKLIKMIADVHDNLTVVGDDDQSIYGWRGAEIENILTFPKNYKQCKVIKLERNYRSSPPILDLGNAVIEKNTSRHGKILKAEKTMKQQVLKPELFVLENEEEEAEFVSREIFTSKRENIQFRDIAVLYRSNTQGAFIESSLRRNQIPYTITGGSSIFDRKESKDWLAYLKQSITMDEVSYRRILNTPPRGLGDVTLEKLIAYANKHSLGLPVAAQKWKDVGIGEKQGQILESLHKWLWTFPQRLIDDTSLGVTISDRFQNLVREIGYRDFLVQNSSEGLIFEKKWQVIEIFSRILESFLMKRGPSLDSIKEFIDAMQLRDDVNDDDKKNAVQLMTFHASKGLEFPQVILVGLEEDLLPHKRLGGDISEERRLFYVGITRAQNQLLMSYCRQRKKMGQIRSVSPSRFILEVNPDLYSKHEHGARPVSGQAREDLVKDFLAGLRKS
jgi:DNA helicase II / ATP-dependent DNA helicase PcrA